MRQVVELTWKKFPTTSEGNRTMPHDGVWVIHFDDDDANNVEAKSPGILLMSEYPKLTELKQADDVPEWADELRAIRNNVERFLETPLAKLHQETESWWREFFEKQDRPAAARSIDAPSAYYPRDNVRRVSAPPPPPQSRAPHHRPPEVDTIEHSGYTRTDRQRQLRGAAQLSRRFAPECSALEPGAYAFVRFEISERILLIQEKIEDGDEDAEEEADAEDLNLIAALDGYRAPLCLARLPDELPDDPATAFEVVWLKPHNNTYGGLWSVWELKTEQGTAKPWKTFITRESIVKTLEKVGFTPRTTNRKNKKALNAQTKRSLAVIEEAKYHDFS